MTGKHRARAPRHDLSRGVDQMREQPGVADLRDREPFVLRFQKEAIAASKGPHFRDPQHLSSVKIGFKTTVG